MIEIENPQEILEWPFEKLWTAYKLEMKELQKEQPENKNIEQEIQQVKEGQVIKYPIQYIIEEWYELYPNNKTARIKGYGRVPLKAFLKDKEKREEIMQQTLIELTRKENIRKPRITI